MQNKESISQCYTPKIKINTRITKLRLHNDLPVRSSVHEVYHIWFKG